MYDFDLKNVLIFFISLALLLIIFNYTVRKLLGVGRKKPFSYHHMNQRHKKLDWSVRIVFIIIVRFFQFVDGIHQSFGDVLSAVNAESSF